MGEIPTQTARFGTSGYLFKVVNGNDSKTTGVEALRNKELNVLTC